MPVSDWHDCMKQSIVWHPFTGRSAYGKPTYGTAVTVSPCRVVYKDFWFRKPDGSEVIAKGIVWLGQYYRISVEDKIVLPDGTDHPILMAESYSDEEPSVDVGHHTKLIFG